MEDFQFYVADDRYEVPTVIFVQTRDAERARFLARRLLALKHHNAVEVWSNNKRLFEIDETEAPPAKPQRRLYYGDREDPG